MSAGWIRKRDGDRKSQDRLTVERAAAFSGTVADLLAWCYEQNVAPELVIFTGGSHLAYPSTETDEERDARLAANAAAAERQERWEREQYERLAAKFGGPS